MSSEIYNKTISDLPKKFPVDENKFEEERTLDVSKNAFKVLGFDEDILYF